MLKVVIKALSLFVFTVLCSLFADEALSEMISLYDKFGTRYIIAINGFEFLSFIFWTGFIAMTLIILKIIVLVATEKKEEAEE